MLKDMFSCKTGRKNCVTFCQMVEEKLASQSRGWKEGNLRQSIVVYSVACYYNCAAG